MKFFVDTADTGEIRDLAGLGLVDGVTTNPSLIAKAGRDILDVTAEICAMVDGPVSAEVTARDSATMLKEAEVLRAIAPNVCIKLPLTLEGLRACRALSSEGVETNVTLCFSVNQALLAAKAGATYVSPFLGRLDDINLDGTDLIADIRQLYDIHGFKTQVLAASVRTPNHVSQVALIGADVATVPPGTLRKLADHPLTASGLAGFEADWAATGQTILGRG